MIKLSYALRSSVLIVPFLLLAPQVAVSQESVTEAGQKALSPPKSAQTGDEIPWIYEGSDIPHDKEWLFGEMDNGVRYATRKNGVPPGQVSIRIRIDAGSMYEEEAERGFAHLLEHLSFRESKYLAQGAAIPTWQRLGASFGSDTNAETSPTHTVYKLDLPNASPEGLEESLKLLSGMMRDPVLSKANLDAEVPIVLAEKRERGGPSMRVGEKTRETLFTGQRLANRLPIGTEATLKGATAKAMQAFHDRWYRPENTVIAVAGDFDRTILASLVEKYFGDWKVAGKQAPAPDFGDPVAPAGLDPANPVGESAVMVEPDLPRNFTFAYLRPWRAVNDTVAYNQGRLADQLAIAILQRRLETRARAGGSFLYASVEQDKVSRSADATVVSFAPLSKDWRAALTDVRAIIADALATPPTQEEIDREATKYSTIFDSMVEQRALMAGSALADEVIGAVDIRESVASPETFVDVFAGVKKSVTPQEIFERTKAMFKGDVIRSVYVTPVVGEADVASVQAALKEKVEANNSARLTDKPISFSDLPPIGEPGQITSVKRMGSSEIIRVDFANGTAAILSADKEAEPGRVYVRMNFGAGQRAFTAKDAPYIDLGESALISSGQGKLGQEELDRISTGRIMNFDFSIEDAQFKFGAQTREADLEDQLYLFANKLADPKWDPNPVIRAKAASELAYESYASSPGGVLQRDLDYLINNKDGRFKTANTKEMSAATAEGFRKVWEPVLAEGNIEILIFGDFDRDAAVGMLARTIGALPPRKPIPADVLARTTSFPQMGKKVEVLTHRGEADQAMAVMAWPTGGGSKDLPESRQLEILSSLFSNRLIDAMRERAGASYSPQVVSNWPVNMDRGGRLTAYAQLRPGDVPAFFAAAEQIAKDLATKPVSADELARTTEPLRQMVARSMSSSLFWLYQVEGSTRDPERLKSMGTLLSDYSETTPEKMQALAQKYLGDRSGWRLAVIPEGQKLAAGSNGGKAAVTGR